MTKRVLITGASVADPAPAYLPARHGFAVTEVERTPTLRAGGYAVNFHGGTCDVLEQRAPSREIS